MALYAAPGIADACLQAQDREGCDVNLLLYACYAAACGQRLEASQIADMIAVSADWRRDMVTPLRALRRRAAGALRERLLEAELLAEQGQQELMWVQRSPPGDWDLGTVAPSGSRGQILRHNLAGVAAASGCAPGGLEGLAALVDVALGGLLPNL